MQNNELDQAAVRTWLKQMPDAGFFADGVWLACDSYVGWHAYDSEPSRGRGGWSDDFGGYIELPLDFFNMPELSGDQWKYSCISVIELAEWQMGQKK